MISEQGKTPSTEVKCFIVGCSRSGTTLLSVLLDRHSRLAVPPETAFYLEIAPKMNSGEPIRIEDILAAWSRLPELGLDVATVVDCCGPNPAPGILFDTILRLYASKREKPFCGEKTPGHWRQLPAILRDFPHARILFMLRDGRDTALSLARMPWWSFDLRAAAEVWLGAARSLRTNLENDPARFKVVRYEDLVAVPEATLEAVMDFVGLRYESQQLDPLIKSGVVLDRSKAWKGRALNVIDDSRVGHWRSSASADEISLLEATLSGELASFGYPA